MYAKYVLLEPHYQIEKQNKTSKQLSKNTVNSKTELEDFCIAW